MMIFRRKNSEHSLTRPGAILLLVLVCLLTGAVLPITAADGPGITISVIPRELCAGEYVTVSGSTVANRENRTVTLVYHPPAGETITLTCQLNADALFRNHFAPLAVTGATGPEGTFEIPLTIQGDDVLMRHVFQRTMDFVDQAEFEAELTLEIDGKESGL